jgi:hypothetical protein
MRRSARKRPGSDVERAELHRQAKQQKIALTAAQPTSKVFTIVEVLENILSHLDLTELTHMEPVNSLWKDLIRSSSLLQEQRFMKAASVTSLVTSLPEPGLSESSQSYWLIQPRLPRIPSEFGLGTLPLPETISTLHPIFDKYSSTSRQGGTDVAYDYRFNTTIHFETKQILSWAPGPWESMFITQPPCKAADLVLPSWMRDSQHPPPEPGYATLGLLRDRIKTLSITAPKWGFCVTEDGGKETNFHLKSRHLGKGYWIRCGSNAV